MKQKSALYFTLFIYTFRCIGGLLQLQSKYCYVLEDESSIVGYALCAPKYTQYREQVLSDWLPSLRRKYPTSTKKDKNHASVTDVSLITDGFLNMSLSRFC